MATLYNTKISATYPGLIKTTDNAALTATLKELTDGSGNVSGLYANTAGDFKVTAILEWGSLKDTGTGVIITQFVTAADGIGNFNNDTTIPTSAAVKTYVDAVVTASDLDFLGDTNTGTPAVDLDSQNFSIIGTANEIETSGAAQTLTIGLPNSVIISGTFTGATFVGDLNGTINTATTAVTQTAGDNSTKVATTAYVDTLDAASDLDFTGDTGTGDVNLNTESFAITGTTNQIVTAANLTGLSLSLPATVHRDLQGNVTGTVLTATQNSITTMTGLTAVGTTAINTTFSGPIVASEGVVGNVAGDLTGNVTATSVLANGVIGTTQTAGDNSTKIATTAYVDVLDAASDLDITGDTGTGDVNLNTQTLNILGTTNEITTAVVNQTATISLPSSISVDLVGNVTGDLTGNADTATTWETARDLSLTGQATATLSNVDGALAVSGAVTLDNNSVTGKVLTGLPTPAAASVLPTDSILEGFGKMQSQINGLAGGLRFMGSWNATTNTPTLASGGGEAASGTTTSTTASKLVDSTANFTAATITVGDQVINQVDGQSALVTNIDSTTTLSLDTDIITSGEAYTIDKTPFLTQGHYYVVSVGGTTSLNGIANWSVGDWVIAGANNEWTQLDHTDVEGTGTAGNIAKWSATGTIADSIISEAAAVITVTGSLATTANLDSGSNFAVNTDKFTANGTTGAVAHLGNLAINTNKFTVNATSGATEAAGTITAPTFSGDLTGQVTGDVTGDVIGNITGTVYSGSILEDGVTATTQAASNNSTKVATTAYADAAASAVPIGDYLPLVGGTLTGGLTGTSATFAGAVTVNGNTDTSAEFLTVDDADPTLGSQRPHIKFTGAGTQLGKIRVLDNSVGMQFLNSADSVKLTISDAGNSTFTGDVESQGTFILNYNNAGNKWQQLFDGANGWNLRYYNGTSWSSTALQINTSNNSTFAGNVDVDGGTLNVGSSNQVNIVASGSSLFPSLKVNNSGYLGSASVPTQIQLLSSGNTVFAGDVTTSGEIKIVDSSATGNPKMSFYQAGNERAYIQYADTGEKLIIDSDSSLVLNTNNLPRLTIDSSGNSTFAGKVILPAEEGSDYKLVFEGGAATSGFSTVDEAGGAALYMGANSIINGSGAVVTKNTLLPSLGINLEGFAQDFIGFYTSLTGNPARRMTISASGNVGIGTDSPAHKLDLTTSDTTWAAAIKNTDSTNGFGLFLQSAESATKAILGAFSGSSYKFYVRGDGNVGIGTDTPSALLEIQTVGTSGLEDFQIFSRGESPNYEVFKISRSAGSTELLANQNLTLSADYDANHTSVDSNIIFKTDNTERMRINSVGDVLFGTQGLPNGTSVYGSAFQKSTVDRMILRMASSITGAAGLIDFFNPNGQVGYIATSGTATLYVTSSDYRLKEDLQDFAGLDMVSKIPVYDFKWKTDEGRSYGVMAHELKEVLPDAVSGEKDAINEDGSINPQGVDYSKIVPLLVKSIQELKAEVDLLKQNCNCKN